MVFLQYLLPQHFLSRLMFRFARIENKWIKNNFTRWFVKKYKVNLSEAEIENIEDFSHFNDFFTRSLKPSLRPISESKIISPVDGVVSQSGKINDSQIVQAKGRKYSVSALTADESLQEIQNGSFATIYLSPKDYHRIHMPMAGTLREMIYVPGDLFSVNPLTANNVPNLFARNERVVTIFDTEYGSMAMVLVGATIVASIETVWAGTITPPAGKDIFRWQYPTTGIDAINLAKGQEMGRFKLGSTVVATFAPRMIEFNKSAGPDTVTRLGQHYADLVVQSNSPTTSDSD